MSLMKIKKVRKMNKEPIIITEIKKKNEDENPRIPIPKAVRDKIEKRSKNKCEICQTNFTNTLTPEVHHKDRDRSNNCIDNLEVLCRNCHGIEHRNDDGTMKRVKKHLNEKDEMNRLITNTILFGNNLDILEKMPQDSVDVISIDPPFFTNNSQKKSKQNSSNYSYSDNWESIEEYIAYMRYRFVKMKNILKPTGSIFVQCDRHAELEINILLNDVFKKKNYRDKIIWQDTITHLGQTSRKFSDSYDVIFWYSKSGKYKFCLDNISTPLPKEKLEKDYPLEDSIGRYKLATLLTSEAKNGKRPNLVYSFMDVKPPKGFRFVCKPATMKKWYDEGIIVKTKTDRLEIKKYMKDNKGIRPLNIWTDIPPATNRDYPTQKPIALAERIILSTTDEGDVVADFFMGSGTTLVAAQKNNRKFIGVDESKEACKTAGKRLGIPEYSICNMYVDEIDYNRMDTRALEQYCNDSMLLDDTTIKRDKRGDYVEGIVGSDPRAPGFEGCFIKAVQYKVDNYDIAQFVAELYGKKNKKITNHDVGFIVAPAFGNTCRSTAAKYANDLKIEIRLITSEDLVYPEYNKIFSPYHKLS